MTGPPVVALDGENSETRILSMKAAQSKLLAGIRAGRLAAVESAIQAGANVNHPKRDPPLIEAASRGSKRIVQTLLNAGASANCTNSLGESILNGVRNPEIAALLIRAGANPNLVPQGWNPPLHLMAANGTIIIAKTLLSHGADVNLRNSDGETPLLVAVGRGQTAMVRLLLSSGADLEVRNPAGDTAIHRSCSTRSRAAVKIVKLLLDAGADPNARDGDRSTPLARACYFRDLEVVRLLLNSGADVNAKDKVGWTPLLSAIRIADAKIVTLLLRAGADLSVRVSNRHDNRSVAGKTVREIAQESSKAVRALLS